MAVEKRTYPLSKPAIELEQVENGLILAVGVVLAAALRYSLWPFPSADFNMFLGPWFEFIRQHGGFEALKYGFADYAPAYLYLLVIATYLFAALPELLAIKLISIIFDFLAAWLVYRIVRYRYPTGVKPLFACLALLFAPTVVLNSSLWSQADIIYTSGLLACLYFLLTRRQVPALLAFGLAFSVKLQAIFLVPLLLVLFLDGTISLKYAWIPPAVYLLTLLPVWLLGRPFADLFFIYENQVDLYDALTLNAPNLYQWLPEQFFTTFYPAGLIWTAAVVFMLCVAIYKSRKQLGDNLIIQLALLSVLIMPYFLPKMHDRYFFPADVIAIIYAFYFPRYFFVPILVGLASLFSYFPFLFGQTVIPLPYLALILGGVIILLLWQLARTLPARPTSEEVH